MHTFREEFSKNGKNLAGGLAHRSERSRGLQSAAKLCLSVFTCGFVFFSAFFVVKYQARLLKLPPRYCGVVLPEPYFFSAASAVSAVKYQSGLVEHSECFRDAEIPFQFAEKEKDKR